VVRNRSKATVQRLVVTDTLPKDATPLETSSANTSSGGGLVWRRASLAPGQIWRLTVRVLLPESAQGAVVNRVRITSANAVAVESQDPVQVRRRQALPVTG
jgi:Domain of unknown function DUF11